MMGRIPSMSSGYCFSISIANACQAPELARSFSAGVSGTPNCTRENKSSSCFRSKFEYSAQRSSSSKNRRLNLSLSMRLFTLTDSPLFVKNLSCIAVRNLTSEKNCCLGRVGHTISGRSYLYMGCCRSRIPESRTDAAFRQPRFACNARCRFLTPFFER